MSTRIARRIVGGGAAALSLALMFQACSDQPKVRCAAARGSFAATYHLVSGSGDCAQQKGDVLAVQTYNGSHDDRSPNWDDASLGIQPSALSGMLAAAGGAMVVDEHPDNKPYGLGKFATAEPGPDDFCVAPELSPARVQLPAIPDMVDDQGMATPGMPEVDVEYRWSNVRVYVTAAANGTMFTADLTLRQGTCTAKYTVDALYPAVSCLVPEPMPPPTPDDATDASVGEDVAALDAAAGDAVAAETDAPTSTDAAPSDAAPPEVEAAPPAPTAAPKLDESLCSAVADPDAGRALGSGINPDVATRCDPDLQMCVLAKAPPVRR